MHRLLISLLGALSLAPALAQPVSLSWDEAAAQLRQGSDRLAAARAQLEQREAQAEGIRHLGGPSVSVLAAAYRYQASLDLDLDPLKSRLDQVLGNLLPPSIGAILPPLPQLPHSYTLERSKSGQLAMLSGIWPIYMGGAADAARGLVQAQGQEARADLGASEEEALAQLAQRYFLTQLAARAAALREAAADTIAQHDAAAEKLLKAGLASPLERLQAQAALADARQQARKARSDAELAASALAHSLRLPGGVRPSSPLALSSQPLAPLGDFIQQALQQHPGLAKVAAKKSQAEQLREASKAINRPQLFAFGQRQIGERGDWVAGVGLRINLWDSLDHQALERGHARQIAQAQASDAQARSDIALLVEQQWRATEAARERYQAMAAQEALGQELLRLRQAALRQGSGTALELIDAELNLAKLRTERAQLAYDYLMSLTQLLAASGQIGRLGEYLARADLRLE
ncbi:TolC family protein [Kinneretia asaccharophila]|uniref:Outer membrane protein TolC n=1 Tax=Roseateles asaccharophilus TaxID=582607 RepID=A0A4R6NAS3_9BURK|nr:TolC family protein [Roseateles asaccharophilus]MDN3546645.1 TolC family protein [Roseateles asaccharophilus]TDP12869.1 outer membrane protein TolC [Roseateles asaccharophilus]